MASSSNPDRARTLGALLRAGYAGLADRLYGRLAARGYADIRPAHSAVLRHLAAEGSRLTELAAEAGMTKQSMAYLVGYLEERGYVGLGPDPADGRARLVRLTARGQRLVDTLLALSAELEAEAARELGRNRIDDLRQTLTDLARVFGRAEE